MKEHKLYHQMGINGQFFLDDALYTKKKSNLLSNQFLGGKPIVLPQAFKLKLLKQKSPKFGEVLNPL